MVKIEISNRAMYFLVTFGIIALFAIGVYAVAPNPGHTASEVEGVCESDGDNCFFKESLQMNLDLFENNNEICYTSKSATSCVLQTETCSASITTTVIISDFLEFDSCDEADSFGELDFICQNACRSVTACNGDTTGFSCGAGSVVYDQSVVESCTDAGFFEMEVECGCSLTSGKTYQKEIPNNGPLCLQVVGQTQVTVVSALCDNGRKLISPNEEIHEEWCGTTLTGLTGCVPFLQKFVHNDGNPDMIKEISCGINSNRLFIHVNTQGNDDERLGFGSICGAVCGANVVIK